MYKYSIHFKNGENCKRQETRYMYVKKVYTSVSSCEYDLHLHEGVQVQLSD